MRDRYNNVVMICLLREPRPHGPCTPGDSITVAPAVDAHRWRPNRCADAAVAIIREVGVDTGNCNIQFATNPRDGEMIVIEELNHVSRSSRWLPRQRDFPSRASVPSSVGYRP